MVKDTFLQRSQRVDVLHIGRTARHARDDAIDRGLVEVDQAQQARGDVGATGRDAVFRYQHLLVAPQGLGQGRDGRLAEQGPYIDLQTFQAQPRGQAYRQQRVATQLEEVVVTAHVLDAQQLRPQVGQQGFGLALRRLVGAFMQGGIRRRQRFTVELAIGRQRQLVEVDVLCRQHVFRQVVQQRLTQAVRLARLTGEVGDQARPTGRGVVSQYHGLAHTGHTHQAGFDLARLDAQATDFDLVVVTAEEDQVAILALAHQVTTAVQLIAVNEGTGDEALGLLLGQTQVTPRYARAADMQLADHAPRHGLVVAVEYIQPGIVDGGANRQCPVRQIRARFQRPGAAIDGGLGRAIHVMQAHTRQALAYLGGQRLGQLTTTADDIAEAGAASAGRCFKELLQQRRHELHHADLLRLDQLRKVVRVTLAVRARQYQA